MRRATVACCCSLLGLVAGEVRADAAGPVRLAYEAAPGCPEEEAFEREVRARLRAGRFAKGDEPARSFRIRLTKEGSGAVARLWVREGAEPARVLEAEACEQAMVAMALVTALAMDGRPIEASPPPPPAPPEGPQVEDEAPREAPPPPPALVASPLPPTPEPSLRALPPILPLPAVLDVVEEASLPPPEKRALYTVGLRAGAESALGPEPLFGGQVTLGREYEAGFELRAFLSWLEGKSVDAGPGRARFRFRGGGLEACQIIAEPLPELRLGPCLGIELGALRGEGLAFGEIVEPRAANRFWTAGRMLGQLRWRAGRLAAELSGGAILPLTRQSFVFEAPHSVIHETPLVGFTLLGGGQVLFP